MSFTVPVVRCDTEFGRRGIRPALRVEMVAVVWAVPCAAQQATEDDGRGDQRNPSLARRRSILARFKKRPVVIEAVQWLNRKIVCPPGPGWFADAEAAGVITLSGDTLTIRTLEGEVLARPGDWVIRGVKGELYPCRDDIFRMTYDPAE